MQKKILSLILSGVLLIQISCFGTFSANTYGLSGGPPDSDICKGFPKNQYGQTMDVYCAFKQLANDQKLTGGRSPGIASCIGLEGENEIRFWHIDHLRDFALEFIHRIFSMNKETLKSEYIKNLSDSMKKSSPLDSKEEANEINKKLLAKLRYFNEAIMPGEFEDYVSYYVPIVTEDEIEHWKIKHEDLVERYTVENCNWFERKFENWFGSCKKKVNKKIEQEFNQYARKMERKADVWYSVLFKAIRSILQGNYKGKDTLVAEMDFSDDDYGSKVYFENIGLSENKKIQHKDVKPILEYFDLIDHHKNDKDEL